MDGPEGFNRFRDCSVRGAYGGGAWRRHGLLRTSFWRSWLGRTWQITLAFTNTWPRLTPFYQVGQAQPCCFGQGKLYHLRQEFKQGILGSILAYESPHTGAPADDAKAVQLLQVWKVRMLRCGSLRERRP